MTRRVLLVLLVVTLCPLVSYGKTKDKHKEKKKEKHPMAATVVGRHIYYPGSSWGSQLAPDKTPLLAGGRGAFANYISYDGGIKGLVVDVEDLADPANLSADDFSFKYGNDNDPSAWTPGAAPDGVAVSEGGGAGGSDRVTLTWDSTACPNSNWLQVTVKATDCTGLDVPDVFYWGLAIGEVGNSETDAIVDDIDLAAILAAIPSFDVPIDNALDIDRDGNVLTQDLIACRDNLTTEETCLKLVTAPVPGPYRVAAGTAWLSGSVIGQVYVTGQEAGKTFLTGGEAGQVYVSGAKAGKTFLTGQEAGQVHG